MHPSVICLGECLIDRLFDRQDLNAKSLGTFWTDLPGGGPANVATSLAKMGIAVGFIGCMGQDGAGESLLQTLTTAGVDCQWVQRHPTAPTRLVLVNRDWDGERHFVGFSLQDPTQFADAQLQVADLPETPFHSASYLVMGTLGLAYAPTAATMLAAKALAQQHGLTLIIDVNWRSMFWPEASRDGAREQIRQFLTGVQVLKLSAEEAQWLFETTNPQMVLSALPTTQVVLITSGQAGCQYATDSLSGSSPGFAVDCEDTTGAGDGFLAGFIHQLHSQGQELLTDADALAQAIRYANAVGALTVTQMGAMTAQPSPPEVEAFLYLHRSESRPS